MGAGHFPALGRAQVLILFLLSSGQEELPSFSTQDLSIHGCSIHLAKVRARPCSSRRVESSQARLQFPATLAPDL